MQKTFSFIFILFLIISLLSALLYTQSKVHHGPITIGLIAELSGSASLIGKSSKNAAILAVNEINKKGGVTIDGEKHEIKLIIADNQSSVSQTQLDAQRLSQKDVIGIVGPNTGNFAIAAGNVAESDKLPLISPWSTDPKIIINQQTGQSKKYVFRAAFIDSLEGKVLAQFAKNTMHAKTAAIFYDASSDVLTQQAIYFRNAFQNDNGKIVAYENYKTKSADFSKQLGNIKTQSPDVIFLPGYYIDAAHIIVQAHRLGITSQFLGSDAWSNQDLLTICGSDCNGYYFGAHFSPDTNTPVAKNFVLSYIQAYNEKPDDVAALTFDSFGLLFQALQNAKSIERNDIRDALANITNFQGVTGMISFKDSNDPIKSVVIMQIKNGAFQWFTNANP